MRRPRRRCLPVLLLVTAAAWGISAVPQRRDSLDPLDPGYYMKSDGVYCQKCPAGTYLVEECKGENISGRCEPCSPGDYMEYPNTLPYCQQCLKCREDQVQRSPCRPDRNTVCDCKDGTFCPPDHPCEMCQKCQARCPEGQVELKPCTPHSDLQCGPATASGSLSVGAIVGISVMAMILVVISAFCYYKGCCSCPGDGRPSSRRPYEMVSSMFRKLPWYGRVSTGTEDNTTNEHIQQRDTVTKERGLPMTTQENEKPKRNMVPAPQYENDPILALRKSFYIFAQKVPMDYWKKFGRSLQLEENDVVMATTDDGFYDMLSKWLNRQGSKSSVNTLLETLDWLHLSGVADDISSTLVKNGLYQDEAEGS